MALIMLILVGCLVVGAILNDWNNEEKFEERTKEVIEENEYLQAKVAFYESKNHYVFPEEDYGR